MTGELETAIVKKIENQDRKIQEIDLRLQQEFAAIESVKRLESSINDLNDTLKKIESLKSEMKQFSDSLRGAIALLKTPVTDKVVHHHHFPKIAFITAGLFLVVCLLSIGWYNTGSELDNYKANDTKWRFLRLLNNKNLNQVILSTDSIYLNNPNMRDSILQAEQVVQEQHDLDEQIEKKEEEMKGLKEKSKGLRNK